ncbi:hypothetical protein [Streptomyces chartreusis]|uniref:hypothetical protein n=1 Tax=Streptomyces chartreusis TaxID=1969 RepID=UPI002F913CF1|nr:hypothetical protein OG938_46670 [Streptomyces chartreusis]WTA33546.1 hypothetical protein OIA45_47125 [Streptomyces chartreusis]
MAKAVVSEFDVGVLKCSDLTWEKYVVAGQGQDDSKAPVFRWGCGDFLQVSAEQVT